MGGMKEDDRLLVERTRKRLARWVGQPPGSPASSPAQRRFPGLAALLEHTLLAPDATARAVDRLCDEAIAHGLHGVCVAPHRVAQVASRLRGTGRATVAVVGFPLGNTTAEVKAYEAAQVVELGATEIDMVLQVGAIKDEAWGAAAEEIAAVVEAARGRPVKVILETGLLTEEEIVAAALLCQGAGAAFVKTSTGFGPRGASPRDVQLLHAAVGGALGIKASGGIRTAAAALAMWEAGADRIGASASVSIVEEGA